MNGEQDRPPASSQLGRRDILKMAASAAPALAAGGAISIFGTTTTRAAATDDLAELTATEAVKQIREGAISAETYATRLLQKYREASSLNAIAWIDESRTLESARAIDRLRLRAELNLPLAGLPLLIKDNISAVGFPSAAGTPALKGYFPAKNAPVVQALLDQGAILFAKANMHELAAGGTSNNVAFGPVRNPYDRSSIPGGSSGGTAAAIAARMVPVGLGTDTAGSVRIPAAFCGIVGLRPTIHEDRKPYSDDGVIPLALDLDTIGPMGRTVADVALLHWVVTGQTVPTAPDLRGLRLGIPRKFYWEDLDSSIEKVTNDGLSRLRSAGAILVEIDPSAYAVPARKIFSTLLLNGIKEDLKAFLSKEYPQRSIDDVIAQNAGLDPKRRFEAGRQFQVSAPALSEVRQTRQGLSALYEEMFRSNDIAAIAFPTEPITAPPIRPGGGTPDDQLELNGRMVSEAMTLPRNTLVTGVLRVPGISLPAGLSDSGMPVGFELDGARGHDRELLAAAMAVEHVFGSLPAPR